MGKKNKKEKKGKGEEKTKQKSDKKADKRLKKELADRGEEDIEKLIAEFQEQDRRRVEVIEERCPPPSPRCNLSLVAHPDREELIMFGGEYFTGNKMYVYNDMFTYQIKKREWLKVSVPNPPPPRSAHQAVTMSHSGGQMWVFGGEFSSHSQAQFYHYKDLWLLHLKEKRWELIKSPGGPTARSGHRMVALKKRLFVFGGFHDNTRDYKYFSDVYIFNTDTYAWSTVSPSGNGPSPRSGCVLFPMPDANKMVIYGGYSKEKMKRDMDAGKTHTDMFVLAQEKKKEGASSDVEKWKWQTVKQSGARPSQRSGMTGVVGPGNNAYLFGGVFDEDEDDEDLDSHFYNDLWTLDLDKAKWFHSQLRSKKTAEKKKRRRKKKEATAEGDAEDSGEEEEEDDDEEEEEGDEAVETAQDGMENLELGAQSVKQDEDGVFTVTQSTGLSQHQDSGDADGCSGMDVDKFWPSHRMNTSMAVRDGVLYMFGGLLEEGDKQVTLADFYSLDVSKMEEWGVVVAEDRKLQEWQDSDDEEAGSEARGNKSGKKRVHESDVSDTGNEDDDDDDDSDDSDDDDDITFDDAPPRREGEGIVDYFARSQDYWVEKARSLYEEEGETKVNQRRLLRFAKELCEEACE